MKIVMCPPNSRREVSARKQKLRVVPEININEGIKEQAKRQIPLPNQELF